MISTTEKAFLQQIVEEPKVELHRLIYADWLEEQDDGVLATFWRASFAETCTRLIVVSSNRDTEQAILHLARLNQVRRDYVFPEVAVPEDLSDDFFFDDSEE